MECFKTGTTSLSIVLLISIVLMDGRIEQNLLVLSRECLGMGVAGIIISYYGSFPHSLRETHQSENAFKVSGPSHYSRGAPDGKVPSSRASRQPLPADSALANQTPRVGSADRGCVLYIGHGYIYL